MKVSERRYVPLLTDDGQLVPRPDYMVLAALSDTEPDGMQRIYEIIILEEQQRPQAEERGMTKVARVIKSKIIEGDVTGRTMAGEVVGELARIAQATGKSPTLNDARRLVAFNHHRMTHRSTAESMVRQVEKSFSKYRNIAHLWAAAACQQSLLEELEGEDERPLFAFLGVARAFEAFVDNNVVSNRFRWNPFRIPERFPTISKVDLPPLGKDELEILAGR